jgi:hypothetical protein
MSTDFLSLELPGTCSELERPQHYKPHSICTGIFSIYHITVVYCTGIGWTKLCSEARSVRRIFLRHFVSLVKEMSSTSPSDFYKSTDVCLIQERQSTFIIYTVELQLVSSP